MNAKEKVKVNKLQTGIPGLDEILGGGLPEFSFNIIAGSPGCGKTTLAHQFVFANATVERPALYFTVLGEPALKMLRYQQQFNFFDIGKLNSSVRFINLAQILIDDGLQGVLDEITKQVEAANASIVVVDSFRTVLRGHLNEHEEMAIQSFVQQLALVLTSWEATTFLVGEYGESDLRDNPVFTVADGLIWLYQHVERNSVVRKLHLMKLRGQTSVPGLHTFRITEDGVEAFSRNLGFTRRATLPASGKRLSTGIAELDKMMGGGIPEGDSILISGSSGAGKSLFATHFVAAGVAAGEAGIVAVFEGRPEAFTARAASFGIDLRSAEKDRLLDIIYLRPLDLSVDEAMQEIANAIKKIGAKRLVIDSLAGFEMALAPGFRADFRESLYRMIYSLTGMGVTVLSTLETEESFVEMPFSNHSISFLTDDLIRIRYVEVGGQLRRIVIVVKMRGGKHSKDIREFEITSEGVVIGGILTEYVQVVTGIPKLAPSSLTPATLAPTIKDDPAPGRDR